MRPFAANPILGYKGRSRRNRLAKWKKRLKSKLIPNQSKWGEFICLKEVTSFISWPLNGMQVRKTGNYWKEEIKRENSWWVHKLVVCHMASKEVLIH